MTFNELIADIKKLTGIQLSSVNPGHNIKIIGVDEERESILLLTSEGKKRSRPFSEIQTIWNELITKPAVHVDEVLHGSGTSRNQPETILANLPYIEWLKINKKKHLSFVDKNTHPFGTIKQMDQNDASLIIDKYNDVISKSDYSVIFVTKDVSSCISFMNNICSGTIATIEQGFYLFQSKETNILFILYGMVDLEEGQYLIIEGNNSNSTRHIIRILDYKYAVYNSNEIKVLYRLH